MSIIIAASAAFLIVLAVLPFFVAAWLLISRIEENEHPYNDHDEWWHQ
jgi:hypothetical protein